MLTEVQLCIIIGGALFITAVFTILLSCKRRRCLKRTTTKTREKVSLSFENADTQWPIVVVDDMYYDITRNNSNDINYSTISSGASLAEKVNQWMQSQVVLPQYAKGALAETPSEDSSTIDSNCASSKLTSVHAFTQTTGMSGSARETDSFSTCSVTSGTASESTMNSKREESKSGIKKVPCTIAKLHPYTVTPNDRHVNTPVTCVPGGTDLSVVTTASDSLEHQTQNHVTK